ncbi:hypothetical protein BX600DRAFT_445809 [Xylariales sp. PMI_506]|nr:hypothetical protein BX600DRAFT_445809 [Xylariales sp. PMI_506]
MLEKTAASFEPCGLQRVLPVAAKSFRSRRQLRTAFWKHGAADVEISNAWQDLMHGVLNSSSDIISTDSSPDSRSSALRASSFLLDFLYPSGTAPLLRRLPFALPERLDSHKLGQSFAKVSPRLYSSSTPTALTTGPVQDKRFAAPNASASSQVTDYQDDKGIHVLESGESNLRGSSATNPPAKRTEPALISTEPNRQSIPIHTSEKTSNHVSQLVNLLERRHPEDADQIWREYNSLAVQDQDTFRGRVLVFLSSTGRVTDSWKISELFRHTKSSEWEDISFSAGIVAELNLQNASQALSIFARGLTELDITADCLVAAFDMLLSAALKSSSPDMLGEIWINYAQMKQRWDFAAITNQLELVAAVPGLTEKTFEISSLLNKPTPTPLEENEELVKVLVRRALVFCTNKQVLPLLRITNDTVAYREFICDYSMGSRRGLIPAVYHAYRELPGFTPSVAVLHRVFDAYSTTPGPPQIAAVEKIWQDWVEFHGTPTRRAFHRFLGFYAAHGEVEKVYSLWEDMTKAHIKGADSCSPHDFSHLLQVHSVRSELAQTQQIFNDMTSSLGVTPDRVCWNILLNAHSKVGDLEGATLTFDQLSESVGADHYSYAILMQMAADRGELEFTIELYRRARREGVQTNDKAILGSLITAYCENDQFQEAEDICVRAANKGRLETRLWNTILHAYALRRDLSSVNRVLQVMTELKVPYDSFTYQQLLLALSLCRQVHHALDLLTVAVKEKNVELTTEHFQTVIGACIKTGEPDLALRIHKLMQKCGFRSSADSIVQLATAFNQFRLRSHTGTRAPSREILLGSALRKFYKAYGVLDATTASNGSRMEHNQGRDSSVSPQALLRRDKHSFRFSRMIYLFAQIKDFMRTQELVRLYRYVMHGDANSTAPLPIQMLNSLLWADLAEKKLDSVRETWELMFSMAKEGALSAEWAEGSQRAQKVTARYRYVLSEGINIMQTVLQEQGNVEGLQELIEGVRQAGFELNSRNWNLHIQALVHLRAYEAAFAICEQWLMPNWTGWQNVRQHENMKNNLPLDLRRRGLNARHLRPTSDTLYHLVKSYAELDKLAPWSAEAHKVLGSIQGRFPRCHKAIMTMSRSHSRREKQILGDMLDERSKGRSHHNRMPPTHKARDEDVRYPKGAQWKYRELDALRSQLRQHYGPTAP